jgi:hypothetical protein
MLVKTQAKVILMLLDDKGHPEWEIAECLKMRECNLNPILNELERREIVFTGLRPSRRQHENKACMERNHIILAESWIALDP